MSIQSLVNFASGIVARQTARIRNRLRKNRSRMVYRVQSEDCSIDAFVYCKYDAIILASHHGAWIYEGRQNARQIRADNLLGIKYHRRRAWYMPKRTI